MQVQRTAHPRAGASRWQTLPGLAATTKTSVRFPGHPGETVRFRVRATATSGRAGRWATTPSVS